MTDEEDIPDAVGRLRMIYKNLLRLDYDNKRTRAHNIIEGAVDTESKSAYELFAELFEKQNNAPMSEEQSAFMKDLIEKIEEEMA